MNSVRCLAALALVAAFACNGERKQECDQFLSAIRPLGSGEPTGDTVARAQTAVSSITFQDQPLREYASSTKDTLKVLSNAIELLATPSPPDGTDDLVKAKLKEAAGERDDVARYCSQ